MSTYKFVKHTHTQTTTIKYSAYFEKRVAKRMVYILASTRGCSPEITNSFCWNHYVKKLFHIPQDKVHQGNHSLSHMHTAKEGSTDIYILFPYLKTHVLQWFAQSSGNSCAKSLWHKVAALVSDCSGWLDKLQIGVFSFKDIPRQCLATVHTVDQNGHGLHR